MPLQNRVDPIGNLHAVPARGTVMGNRGILHDDQQRIIHHHRHKNWIICKLTAGRRQRTIMTPGRYTELFFLDEATALAAGHRPCGRCSTARYTEFVRLFKQANPHHTGRIDELLHQDRFVPYRRNMRTRKKNYTARVDDLPTGTFVLLEPDPSAQPYLVLDDTLYRWRFDGYGAPMEPRPDQEVTVLTPACTVRTLAAGYRPTIYPEKY